MHVFVFQTGSLIGDYKFSGQTVTVGSSATCQIPLADTRVSPVHLRVAPQKDGAWSAVPVDSADGVQINGAPLHGDHTLKEMDEIVIGPFLLRFYFSEFGKQHAVRQFRKQEAATQTDGVVLHQPGDAVSLSCNELLAYRMTAAAIFRADSSQSRSDAVLADVCTRFGGRIACLRLPERLPAQGWRSHCKDRDGQPADPPPVFSLLQSHCEHRSVAIGMPAPASGIAAPLPDGAGGRLGMLFVQLADAAMPVTAELVGRFAAYATMLGPEIERALNAPPPATSDSADDLARVIQDSLTPTTAPNWPAMQVAAYRHNGREQVSDVYDMLRLANGTSSFLVARVNAHGAPLARLLTEAWTAFRTGGLHAESPQTLMRAINWLAHDGRAAYTIDAATLWIAGTTGAMQLCVAGTGIWAGVIPAGGEYQDLTAHHGPPIGASRGSTYQAVAKTLEQGDTVVIGTSGVDAVRSREGAVMGRAAAIELLTDLAGRSPSVMLSGLAAELDEFARGGQTPQDVTVVVARRS